MSLEMIERLEELVDQLLSERSEIQAHNQKLSDERAVLMQDRARVSAELDKLLDKLEQLGTKTS